MEIRDIMTVIIKDIFLPVICVALMCCIAYPICNKTDGFDFFRFWIIVGFPFGIRRMFLWLIPHGYGISGTMGIVGLNCIVGGIIGGFVIMALVIKGAFSLIRIIVCVFKGKTTFGQVVQR